MADEGAYHRWRGLHKDLEKSGLKLADVPDEFSPVLLKLFQAAQSDYWLNHSARNREPEFLYVPRPESQ